MSLQIFMLYTLCMFLQSIYYSTNALSDTSNIFNCYMSQQWDAIFRKLLGQRCTRCRLVGQLYTSVVKTPTRCWNKQEFMFVKCCITECICWLIQWFTPDTFLNTIFDKHKVVPAHTMTAYRVKSHSFLPSPPDRVSGKLHNLAA